VCDWINPRIGGHDLLANPIPKLLFVPILPHPKVSQDGPQSDPTDRNNQDLL
jgi:hypothetical protein